MTIFETVSLVLQGASLLAWVAVLAILLKRR